MSEIDHLKEELLQAKLQLAKQNTLLLRREELEVEINKLEAQHAKQALLKELKAKRQQIDHVLDSLEDFSEERVDVLRHLLREKTIELYPERALLYEELNHLKKKTLFFQELSLHLTTLLSFLVKARESREKIKRRGILSYIFGENPTVAISTNLEAAGLQAKRLAELLKGDQNEPLLALLHKLHEECKKPWGFNRIDTFFIPAENELVRFLAENDQSAKNSLHSFRQKQSELEAGSN